MTPDHTTEIDLIEESAWQREAWAAEAKWMLTTHAQWVQREMIRVRDGKGWIEFTVNEDRK